MTIPVPIPQRHHRLLLAGKGSKIQEICHACNVQIKFPERGHQSQQSPEHQPSPPSAVNGGNGVEEHSEGFGAESHSSDFVHVTGRIENCEKAKEMLLVRIFFDTVALWLTYRLSLSGRSAYKRNDQRAF